MVSPTSRQLHVWPCCSWHPLLLCFFCYWSCFLEWPFHLTLYSRPLLYASACKLLNVVIVYIHCHENMQKTHTLNCYTFALQAIKQPENIFGITNQTWKNLTNVQFNTGRYGCIAKGFCNYFSRATFDAGCEDDPLIWGIHHFYNFGVPCCRMLGIPHPLGWRWGTVGFFALGP